MVWNQIQFNHNRFVQNKRLKIEVCTIAYFFLFDKCIAQFTRQAEKVEIWERKKNDRVKDTYLIIKSTPNPIDFLLLFFSLISTLFDVVLVYLKTMENKIEIFMHSETNVNFSVFAFNFQIKIDSKLS